MSKTALLCLAAILACGSAQAQVTLDLAKVTCDQWAGYKITNPQNIALWLSGYQHGRQGATQLDTQRLTADVDKLRSFCLTNPTVPVMDAAAKVLLSEKK